MKFKTGDKVKCINKGGHFSNGFTEGNVYEVGGEYQKTYEKDNDPTYVGVVADDNGTVNGWNVERFEKVEEPKMIDFKVGTHYLDRWIHNTVLCIHRQDKLVVFIDEDGDVNTINLNNQWEIDEVLEFEELPPPVLDKEVWAIVYDQGGIPYFLYFDNEVEGKNELQFYDNDPDYSNVRLTKVRVTEIL